MPQDWLPKRIVLRERELARQVRRVQYMTAEVTLFAYLLLSAWVVTVDSVCCIAYLHQEGEKPHHSAGQCCCSAKLHRSGTFEPSTSVPSFVPHCCTRLGGHGPAHSTSLLALRRTQSTCEIPESGRILVPAASIPHVPAHPLRFSSFCAVRGDPAPAGPRSDVLLI